MARIGQEQDSRSRKEYRMTEVNEVSVSSGGDDGGGGMGKIIKIAVIALVALLIIGGGIFGVMMLFGDDEEEMAAAPGTPGASSANTGAGTAIVENPVFLPIGTFIVNLSDGRRYLKTNLELMLSEELAKAYLEKRLAEVKDIVVSELQVLSTEQLRDPLERANLKQRLLRSIESLLPNKDVEWDDPLPIKKVLVTEFYLQ